MDLSLKDKVIMVAGSSKGLGYGIAEALAADGAKLSIASRSEESINSAATALKETYATEVLAVVFDASSPESIEAWTAKTIEKYSRIDGLVVNAGGPPPGKFDDLGEEAWNNGFNLTLMSSVRMIRSVLPQMREQKSGSIVTITSTSVKEPIDVLLLSNVFRSGVVSLVKSLSIDLASEGIRINNLVPGRMDTQRIEQIDVAVAARTGTTVEEQKSFQEGLLPMGRYGGADEFGKAGAFLLSDAASYITGSTLTVDGGMTKTVW